MEIKYWRKCGSCKKEIYFNALYQACSVSSCSKFAFCSVECWGQHNPVMNHKSSWAEERRSPKGEGPIGEPRRRIVVGPIKEAGPASLMEHEVLIVASKLKQYIKEKHDMNTSGNVMDVLSHQVRRLADSAVEKARGEGRKTVMDRDFE